MYHPGLTFKMCEPVSEIMKTIKRLRGKQRATKEPFPLVPSAGVRNPGPLKTASGPVTRLTADARKLKKADLRQTRFVGEAAVLPRATEGDLSLLEQVKVNKTTAEDYLRRLAALDLWLDSVQLIQYPTCF